RVRRAVHLTGAADRDALEDAIPVADQLADQRIAQIGARLDLVARADAQCLKRPAAAFTVAHRDASEGTRSIRPLPTRPHDRPDAASRRAPIDKLYTRKSARRNNDRWRSTARAKSLCAARRSNRRARAESSGACHTPARRACSPWPPAARTAAGAWLLDRP